MQDTSFTTMLRSNVGEYFSPFNRRNHYRLGLAASICIITFAKVWILKDAFNYYKDRPTQLLKEQNETENFALMSMLSAVATVAWISLDLFSNSLKSKITFSLAKDMNEDTKRKLSTPKLMYLMNTKFPGESKLFPEIQARDLLHYTKNVIDYSIGGVVQLVDFGLATYNFSKRSDAMVTLVCFTFTALSSLAISNFFRDFSSTLSKKSIAESGVRSQASSMLSNSHQIASKKAERLEIETFGDDVDNMYKLQHSRSSSEKQYSAAQWLSGDLSTWILMNAIVIFSRGKSFNNEYIPLSRELYQARAFVSWLGEIFTSRVCLLNENIYKVRAALAKCQNVIENSKLKIEDSTKFEIDKLVLHTQGQQRKLLNVDALKFQAGVYLLSGENGSGKSTFLNAVAGLALENSEGKISISNNLVYVPQNITHKSNVKLIDLILYPKKIEEFCETPTDIRDKIINLLKTFELKEFYKDLDQVQDWSKLSGGESQVISLIQALIQKPKVLLLDEITSAMSKENRVKAKELVIAYHKENTDSVVIHIEHAVDNPEQYYTHRLGISGQKLHVQKISTIESKKHR